MAVTRIDKAFIQDREISERTTTFCKNLHPEGFLLVKEEPRRHQVGGLYRVFDLKMAIAGALFLGTIVFAINLRHSLAGATTAALKQGAYTFFFGGLVTRMCKTLAVRGPRPAPALLLAVALPGVVAVTATLLLHNLKGTPEPLISTLPTALLAPPAFFTLGVLERRRVQPSSKS